MEYASFNSYCYFWVITLYKYSSHSSTFLHLRLNIIARNGFTQLLKNGTLHKSISRHSFSWTGVCFLFNDLCISFTLFKSFSYNILSLAAMFYFEISKHAMYSMPFSCCFLAWRTPTHPSASSSNVAYSVEPCPTPTARANYSHLGVSIAMCWYPYYSTLHRG